MERVHIAFGGNVGDVEGNLRRALESVGGLPRTRLRKVSSLYRTAPVGVTDQPDFLNGVAEIETALSPSELLAELLAIEGSLGRTRATRWGPRTVDLDIVLWGGQVVNSPDLEVPHPRMHERAFVLVPLNEIAPQARHPRLNRSVRELSESLPAAAGVAEPRRPGWIDDLEGACR
jgi:2-amino-4-hydroxy-6-hydroxymethyldihydropteridine diphosphokinase